MTVAASATHTLAEAIGVIERRTGLTFSNTRRDAIDRALEQMMDRLRVRDPERLARMLEEPGPVFDEVLHHVTVGETYFFREPAQFDLLRDTVLPSLLEANAGRELRVWSAACATGEEAYSLAITTRNSGANAQIVGTDVDPARVGDARRGRYRQWSLRGLTPNDIGRYFARDGEDYCLQADLRRAVTFSRLNLVEDAYPSASGTGMDIIVCRNVLIYFSADVITTVCRRLIDALSPTGWLFVGASDPLVVNYADCDVVETRAGLAYRRRGVAQRPRTVPLIQIAALPVPVIDARPPPSPPPVVVTAPPIEREAADTTLVDLALTVRTYANLGRAHDAERFCIAALEQAPESSELHALHATLLLQAGHPRPAAVAARRALYLDRDYAIARIALGDAHLKLGDNAAATRAYTIALEQLELQDPAIPVPGTGGESRDRLLASLRDRMPPVERVS